MEKLKTLSKKNKMLVTNIISLFDDGLTSNLGVVQSEDCVVNSKLFNAITLQRYKIQSAQLHCDKDLGIQRKLGVKIAAQESTYHIDNRVQTIQLAVQGVSPFNKHLFDSLRHNDDFFMLLRK